jgi:hypothetical protein
MVDNYLKYPYTGQVAGASKEHLKDIKQYIKDADFYVIHGWPREYWSPLLSIEMPDKTHMNIKLKPDNHIMKFHGTDVVKMWPWIRANQVNAIMQGSRYVCVTSPDWRMNRYVNGVQWIPTMMDPELLPARDPRVNPDYNKYPLTITHSPTFRHTKGTKVIHKAMGIIRKKKLPIKIKILENRPWQESLKERTHQADIYFDQVFWGHYGVASVEAMMMGMPVMAWISNYTKSWDPSIPIINVKTAEDIVEWAQKCIEGHVEMDSNVWREWAIKHHAYKPIKQWKHLIEWAAEAKK